MEVPVLEVILLKGELSAQNSLIRKKALKVLIRVVIGKERVSGPNVNEFLEVSGCQKNVKFMRDYIIDASQIQL